MSFKFPGEDDPASMGLAVLVDGVGPLVFGGALAGMALFGAWLAAQIG